MLKTLQKKINNRVYSLYLNNKKINIKSQRIKNTKDYINNLAKTSKKINEKSYFFYNKKNFASFGMSELVDIVWVSWDGKVIYFEKLFQTNKISKSINGTKFIYILPPETIKIKNISIGDIFAHEYNRNNKIPNIF